jgi:hypothetical protein
MLARRLLAPVSAGGSPWRLGRQHAAVATLQVLQQQTPPAAAPAAAAAAAAAAGDLELGHSAAAAVRQTG